MYPGDGSVADGICVQLVDYDLQQIRSKKTLARANAITKLTGKPDSDDEAICQALWDILENKRLTSTLERFERLVRAGAIVSTASID